MKVVIVGVKMSNFVILTEFQFRINTFLVTHSQVRAFIHLDLT